MSRTSCVERCRKFTSFFALQFILYIILVANIRAISGTHYLKAALTEAAYLILQWTVIKRVVEAKTLSERIGYILGGVSGGAFAMWLTKTWSG